MNNVLFIFMFLFLVLIIPWNDVYADTTLSVRVNADSDSREQRGIGGTIDAGTSDMELTWDNGLNEINLLRFNGLTIPQGATIVSADIQFTATVADSGTVNITIKGEDIDNSPTVVTAVNNISDRTTTTASVAWNIPAWSAGESGADTTTPDLKTIAQEIVEYVIVSNGAFDELPV